MPYYEEQLKMLRDGIDAIDAEVVRLANERAEAAAKSGRLKQASGATRYAPAREWGVLDNVVALNKGPLADHAIQAIYRDLVSGWFPLVTPP